MTRDYSEPTKNYEIILKGMDAYKVEVGTLESILFEIATTPELTIEQIRAMAKEAVRNIGHGAAESEGAEGLRAHLKLNANNIQRNKERQRIKRGQPAQKVLLAPMTDDELAAIEENSVSDEEFEEIARKQGWIK